MSPEPTARSRISNPKINNFILGFDVACLSINKATVKVITIDMVFDGSESNLLAVSSQYINNG
jgi:hypothetical protein